MIDKLVRETNTFKVKIILEESTDFMNSKYALIYRRCYLFGFIPFIYFEAKLMIVENEDVKKIGKFIQDNLVHNIKMKTLEKLTYKF